MSKINLSIIIVTYNSRRWISKCIDSLIGSLGKRRFEIIVVDNNSPDKTSDLLSKKFKQKVNLVRNEKNLGFSNAVNIGIKLSKGERILLVNPDVVVRSNTIWELVKAHLLYKAGISGSKLLKKSGQIHGTYVRKPNILTALFDYTNLRKIVPNDIIHKTHYYLNEGLPTKPKEVDAVSGALMLIDRSVINKIGYLDKNFFMYLEDIDFCTRAKMSGFKVIYCPSSIAFHQGGASSKNRDKIHHEAWSQSRKYYYTKHFSRIENLVIQPLFFIDGIVVSLWQAIK